MSKLNKKVTPAKTVQQVAAKHNLELGYSANSNLQFKKEPLQHLYELAVSTLLGRDSFYKSSDSMVKNIQKEIRDIVRMGELDFIANLAIHARTEMNIRTIPLVIVVEFAKALRETDQSYSHMRQLVCDVIQRADQITDLYAYALDVFGDKKKVPMAIKRGVADAFNKFGEYEFAKYDRNNTVKFRDVLRIVHPTAKNVRQGQLFQKIMEDTLTTPYTWEVELSVNGQRKGSEKKTDKQLWTELVTSGKVGYMALLRNMRNISQAGVEASVIKEHVTDIISDPVRVEKSKQLTFNFVEAYNAIKPFDAKMATAVSKAIDVSTKFLPKLGKKVWIIIDFSGSMGGPTGLPINTATLLASALLKANEDADNVAVTLFGSSAKTLKGVDTNNSVFAIQQELLRHRVGSISGSTDFEAALDERSRLSFKPDTIVVFTDGEVNRFPYAKLKQATHGNDVVKIVVNMEAAATTPMPKQEGWFYMAGWSTNMFKWIGAIREKETIADKLAVPYIGLKQTNSET